MATSNWQNTKSGTS